MSHTIKLEDQVYDQLEVFRNKRETFSEAVERLLQVPGRLREIASILEGQVRFREWQSEQLEKTASPH